MSDVAAKDIPLEACPFCKCPGVYEESDWPGYLVFNLGCSDAHCIAHKIKCDAPIHNAEESIYDWNDRK
jgi:hypothetical protein